jgi:hypothetical protein
VSVKFVEVHLELKNVVMVIITFVVIVVLLVQWVRDAQYVTKQHIQHKERRKWHQNLHVNFAVRIRLMKSIGVLIVVQSFALTVPIRK